MFNKEPWLSATIEFDEMSAVAFDEHAFRLEQIGADFGNSGALSTWAEGSCPGDITRSLLGIAVDGHIRASAMIRAAKGRRSIIAHVMVGVEENWRRQKMGTGLLHRCIEIARTASASQIVVHDMTEMSSVLWMQHLAFDLLFRREACEAWLDLKYAIQDERLAIRVQ